MAGRVEIIERRRLVVGDREFDLAALVPEEGGPATRELEAADGGREFDEAVVLGTAEGVYRFTVARPNGGPLTVEAKPLAPHAEVTRMRVDGSDAARRGRRRRRSPASPPTCSRAAAAT